METSTKTIENLQAEVEELRYQLYEANETIEAIRTGQVDALVVQSGDGHQLYTLKSADHAYRIFIEKMTEGALTLNKEAVILYCNTQFASMVQSELSNVIGKSFKDFIAHGKSSLYKTLFKKSRRGDCKIEVELKTNTNTLPVQLSLNPLELEDEIALSIIVTDLTAQKKAQAQLEHKNRQLAEINHALELSNNDLQQFASVASHDLQEPLRKIQMFSTLLKEQEEVSLSANSRKFLNKIINSAGRMKTLIVDVLNYSKLSANQNAFECINLNDLLKELLEDFELIATEKDAVITVDPLPNIDVNRGQIRQVFQNIISNAIKFSKNGNSPVIHIKSRLISGKSFESDEQKDGPYCFISIKDNGIGFDERYVANIFTLFERLHSKDLYEGTGIGLAISKKIIEKHNGLITAQSQEGKGAEFKIILPVNQ